MYVIQQKIWHILKTGYPILTKLSTAKSGRRQLMA